MNDYVIITINGRDYYCPSNLVQYITDEGINTYSSTITLYGSLREYNNNNSGYPQITLQSYMQPIYRGSYNATQSTLTITSIEFNKQALLLRKETQNNYFSLFLLVLISLVVLFRRS